MGGGTRPIIFFNKYTFQAWRQYLAIPIPPWHIHEILILTEGSEAQGLKKFTKGYIQMKQHI